MRIRNNYEDVPRHENGKALKAWYTVEQEPGVCVGGEDGVFDYATRADAETAACNLVATSGPEYPLTVVKHTRQELSVYSVRTSIEKVDL